MRQLLIDALEALTFADELLGKPYSHETEEMSDSHYHLLETIEKIRQELYKPAPDENVDVSDSGC